MAFYERSIETLDSILDRLRQTATMHYQTGDADRRRGTELREAADQIEAVRNELIAADHDSERARENGRNPS